ncbi:MAG TPA: hypothetical protein VFV93_05455 [Thermomicrobiales bacterium]|nr:hypothetical protein [Thermomicrobiales bacterium]
MVQFIDDKPSRRLRRPHRRHFLVHVSRASKPKARNTVIYPWVDVTGDVRDINEGLGVRIGNTVSVNGRTYGIEPSTTLYPIAGPGFAFLDRGSYKALGYYNEIGITDLAEEAMDRTLISSQSREHARSVLEIGDRDE